MRAIYAVIFTVLLPFSALAQSCGGVEEAPCTVQDGEYHIVMPDEPVAGAVMMLHGYGGTGRAMARNTTLRQSVTARGFALIAPQGLPRQAGARGGMWNSRGFGGTRDDVAFLNTVAHDAAERFGIPRDQIVLSGFSGGGMMTWRVVCDAPGRVRAYAPIAGLLWEPLPQTCNGSAHVLHTHGWSDEVVPLEGRVLRAGSLIQGDVFEGLALLRDSFDCRGRDPDQMTFQSDYLIRSWSECAPGGSVSFALHEGGHSIPRGWTDLLFDWLDGG